MTHKPDDFSRRTLLMCMGVAAMSLPATVQAAGILSGMGLGATGLGGLLNRACDNALDKLGQPGAFYADPAVRIGLPGMGGGHDGTQGDGIAGMLGGVLAQGSKLGLTPNLANGFLHKLNDAAGHAAVQAKPVFHSAISRLSLGDMPGIVGRSDGATQYLRTSSGVELGHRLRPLIDTALAQVGAYKLLGSVGGVAGIGPDKLGQTVTDQALNGIFRYIAGEERRLRADPMGPAGALMKNMFQN